MSKLNVEEEILKNARVALDVAGRILNHNITYELFERDLEALGQHAIKLAQEMTPYLDALIPKNGDADKFEEQLGDHA